MTTTWQKDPEAVLDWDFDWSDWLESGETISSYVVTVPTGITLAADGRVGAVITAWLSGGTVGSPYRVECKITTSDGRTDERSLTIRVQER